MTSAWLLVLQAAILLVITGTVVTRYWSDHIWLGWLLLGVAAAAWAPELRANRVRRWWFLYVAGIFLYTLLRSYADETAIPVQMTYAIEFDRWLPGPMPTTWLQEQFFDPNAVAWQDYAAVAVHWSFFIAPHLAAVLVFVFRRDLFARYVVLQVGIMYAGLVLFFLVPTAPPWLAEQQGHLPGVYRIMDFVGGSVNASTYESFHASLGEPNSVAAMPSIHMAVTFALFLWALEYERRWAVPLLLYSLLMGLTLVYLGEHYVVDELVGIVWAVGVYIVARKVPRISGTPQQTEPTPEAQAALR